jgi:hypothetical protein
MPAEPARKLPDLSGTIFRWKRQLGEIRPDDGIMHFGYYCPADCSTTLVVQTKRRTSA